MKEIELTQGLFALVDNDDYDYLKVFKWYAQKDKITSYAVRYEILKDYSKKLYMHRIIMKAKPKERVAHINGNGLDNRKSNLFILTNRQICQNFHIPKTSKFPGVHYHKPSKKFCAQINIKDVIHLLGYFDNEVDAFTAYKNAVNSIGEDVFISENIDHNI